MTDLDARNALARELRELIEGKLLGAQVADLVDHWLPKHDDQVIERFLASREIVAADMTDRWRKLIHGEDHVALMRVARYANALTSIGDGHEGEALLGVIDGTSEILTQPWYTDV